MFLNCFEQCESLLCGQCRDVRTREVGIQEIHHKVRPYQVTGYILEMKPFDEVGALLTSYCSVM